ncbi:MULTISPECIES: serine/threonine-protein kinase [unclassified Nostoc]|uniref:serine/threonine protein kinase n=1 Tax=unclassified Nostoc TaxID=2593658 RepID=UPI000DECE148|nr:MULTISPECIES: serine/threonine-protein kinase [unclassified Nostoc]MBD2509355.1 serine/threonine protein kinase [Desmonostoc muscorum FACHB-395]QHG17843.1 protein kinase [Nostoc sp. ATCC 53789]QLE50598.1 serine/threonine protein kinase [Nostoc sp. C057]RCJ26342.1 serine/threonine protein kinase [Nostoc sp. ATCC 53789]
MLQPEQILQDRYQIQHQLGNNGIRQTWLAKDLQASDGENSTVVVKLLAFGGTIQWDDLKLFEREAQILKQLNHPRIPRYIDYFCIDDRTLWFGLIQQYIPGESLKEKLALGKRFTEKRARKIAGEILNILMYLHELNPGVLHRDIKPSNLIWGEDNRIYLVDFGAVQDKAAREGVTFTVVGTYGYAPMEQFGGRAVPASDLYALGATLIHLLTGISPSDLPQQDLRLQFADRVNLSPSFASWLQKLIEPAPEQRFTDARQALNALKSGLAVKSANRSQLLPLREIINNSGCGISNQNETVPEEILGWNWGAFLMPWLWMWPNQVWYGLFCFVPHGWWLMAIALGAKGNEWAWKSRQWRSIEQFKAHQRGWAIAGILIGAPISIMLWVRAIALLKAAF